MDRSSHEPHLPKLPATTALPRDALQAWTQFIQIRLKQWIFSLLAKPRGICLKDFKRILSHPWLKGSSQKIEEMLDSSTA